MLLLLFNSTGLVQWVQRLPSNPVNAWLAERAAAIGGPVPQRVTTTDADLRLMFQGRMIKPIYGDDKLVIFTLPRRAGEVRLVSRAQAPTEARPWLDDRRRLGVRVKRIVLRGADGAREVPMDHPDIVRGWWDIERDGPMIPHVDLTRQHAALRPALARPGGDHPGLCDGSRGGGWRSCGRFGRCWSFALAPRWR
jgi:hypothetical protein